MTRLRQNESCPIHHRYDCCGRESRKPKTVRFMRGPVKRIPDPYHPRGYREICTPAELRRRKHILIARGDACWLCPNPWKDYREITLEHKEPKGMGGARRDDHFDNLALAHLACNQEKGSKRL